MLLRIFNPSSYLSLQVVGGYRHWRKLKLIFHKVVQEKGDGVQIWRSARKGRIPASADMSVTQLPNQECCRLFVVVSLCVMSLQINP